MKWNVRNADDVIVFDLKGALEGAHDAYQLKDAVRGKIQEGHRKFLINLDQVDFINSTGIGAQLSFAGRYIDRFEKRDGEWRIAKRMVVYDWIRHLGSPEGTEAQRFGPRVPQGAPFPQDPVYALLRG